MKRETKHGGINTDVQTLSSFIILAFDFILIYMPCVYSTINYTVYAYAMLFSTSFNLKKVRIAYVHKVPFFDQYLISSEQVIN